MLRGEFYDLAELFPLNPDSKVYNLAINSLSNNDVKTLKYKFL